jgi:hypothetical protein
MRMPMRRPLSLAGVKEITRKELRMLTDKEGTQTNAKIGEADSRTSLEQLIPLLQGSPAAALADAGLTLLGTEQLVALEQRELFTGALLYDGRRARRA